MTENLKDIHGFIGVAMRQSTKSWKTLATPADAVRKAGGDPAALTGLILSHGHYDHLGGLLDLPGLPIWTPAAEIEDAKRGAAGEPSGELPAEAIALLPRAQAIPFEGPAVGPWPRSWDIYGDGSVVVVPMPGHTPGSVGTLVRLPDGRRMLHVGDTVWAREGYELREPKGWIAGSFDDNASENDVQIQLLWQLHQADPSLLIVPAHDSRQWDAVFGAETCLR